MFKSTNKTITTKSDDDAKLVGLTACKVVVFMNCIPSHASLG